ncbi:zinc finger jing-like [Brachionus plicatilis]|uniref:Zinc finger jing-like n=1 Tax=Brachionus plicatilis TaxID=10195 RepID=A0A3M7R3Z5_BRAPC|nr:zinc finger jing-like [Brachionus plicatilis]
MSSGKKRMQIGYGKALRKAKYRRMSSSGITASSESNSSVQLSTSASISELVLDSIKGSPTPSITSDSLISDDMGSASNKSCMDSNQTCHQSPSIMSICSSDDEKTKNLSQYSNSASNESLNSNKRITRNTSRLLEASSLSLNESSSASSLTSHQDETEPNRKRCCWHRCRFSIDADKTNDQLIEHVKNKHILSQKNNKKFNCLWKDCKFYEKSSTSFMWLERHVIDHIDSRPYYCVFSGCNRKFRTQAELSRHCDLHFNTSNTSNNSNSLTAQLNTINGPLRTSPVKNRQQKHIILNTAKKALIHNIKHKNKSCSELSELNGNLASSDTNLIDGSSHGFISEKSKSSSNLLNQQVSFVFY